MSQLCASGGQSIGVSASASGFCFFVLFCFCLENRTTLFATLTVALPGVVAVVYMECPEWGTQIASISPGRGGKARARGCGGGWQRGSGVRSRLRGQHQL